jgi:hypothetical protein
VVKKRGRLGLATRIGTWTGRLGAFWISSQKCAARKKLQMHSPFQDLTLLQPRKADFRFLSKPLCVLDADTLRAILALKIIAVNTFRSRGQYPLLSRDDQ